MLNEENKENLYICHSCVDSCKVITCIKPDLCLNSGAKYKYAYSNWKKAKNPVPMFLATDKKNNQMNDFTVLFGKEPRKVERKNQKDETIISYLRAADCNPNFSFESIEQLVGFELTKPGTLKKMLLVEID